MKILSKIPVEFSLSNVKKELHWNEKRSSERDILSLLDEAKSLIQARALYEVAYIGGKGKDTVKVNGITFRSRVLRINLEPAEKIFPYIISIGKSLEDKASASTDLLTQYYLETIGDMALVSAESYLEEHLKRQHGLKKLGSMSPGSLEDWPVTEQKPLFSLFDKPEMLIGVRLNSHMMMIPRKSISGIFFPTEEDFFSCQLCTRERCPSRKAHYDDTLLKKYQSSG